MAHVYLELRHSQRRQNKQKKTRPCRFRRYRNNGYAVRGEQFDCVIFGDVLEHLFDPWAVIEKVKPYIKENGVILAVYQTLLTFQY